MITEILIVFISLLFAAFFAGTETAFVTKLYRISSGPVEWWRRRPEAILTTTLLGTNIAIVTASSVATEIAVQNLGGFGELLVTIGLSVFALIFCETLPKSVALKRSEEWTRISAIPLLIFHFVMFVAIFAMTQFSKMITAVVERVGREDIPQPVEVMEVLRRPIRGLDEGRLVALLVFLRFAGRRVLDIMIPKNKLGRVSLGVPAREAQEIILGGAPYVIVYDGERAVGVLDATTAGILHPDRMLREEDVSRVFVPEVKDAVEYLGDVCGLGFTPAVVVDEFGGVVGAVGGEPMIHRIIRTRTVSSQSALLYPNTSIILPADTPVEKLELLSGTTFPKGHYQTIGGLITEITHRIPKPDEIVECSGIRFRILASDNRKVHKVEVMRIC